MAKIHKGDFQVQNGLGLPVKTTAALGTQPAGYVVFDDTVKKIVLHDGTDWKQLAFAADVAGDVGNKVSKAGDTMTGDLVIAGSANVELASVVAGSANARLVFSLDAVDNGFLGEDAGKLSLSSTNRDLALSAGTANLTVAAANVSLTGTALTVNTTADFTGEVTVLAPVNANNPVTLAYLQANSSASLVGLTDTTIASEATGESLFYNGTAWVNRDIVLADISDFDDTAYATGAEGDLASTAVQPTDSIGVLADVDLSTPASDAQVLSWSTDKFVPVTLPTGVTTFAGLSDVNLDAPGEGAILVYDDFSDEWVNGVIGDIVDLSVKVDKAGDTMTGDLVMGDNAVRFENTTFESSSNEMYITNSASLISIEATDVIISATGDGPPGDFNVSAGNFLLTPSSLTVPVAATFSGTTTVIAPTADLHAATKKYVDDELAAVSAGAASAIDDLTDVTITTPADGHVLVYNASDVLVNRVLTKADVSDFTEGDYATAAQGTLADSALQDLTGSSIGTLSDVDTTGIAEGDFLVWDNTAGEFVPGQVAATDLSNYVTIDGDETITGAKTFTNDLFQVSTTRSDEAIKITNTSTKFEQVSSDGLSEAYQTITGSSGRHYFYAKGNDGFQDSWWSTYQLDGDKFAVNIFHTGEGNSELSISQGIFTLNNGGDALITQNSGGLDNKMEFGVKATSPVTVDGDDADVLTTKAWVLSKVAGAGAATSIGDLSDVTIGTTAAGHAIMRNAGDTAWENRPLVEGDISDFGSYAIVGHGHTKADISDFVEANYVHVTGDETIAGEKTFSDDATFSTNVTIAGDLTVGGTTTTVNSTDLDIVDSIITLNKGEAGAGVTNPNQSGLAIDRGTEDNVAMIWSEANDRFGYADLDGSGNVTVASFKAFAFADDVASNSAVIDFIVGDWVAGEFTISQATHGVAASKIYHVTVIEGGDIVGIETSISAGGDVTLKTSGAAFAGSVRISL